MKTITMREFSVFVRYVLRYQEYKFFDEHPFAAYEYRCTYVLSGHGVSWIDGVSYPLKHGSVLIFQPGLPFMHLQKSDVPLELVTINFDCTHAASGILYPLSPSPIEEFNPAEITEQCCFLDYPALNRPIYIPNMLQLEPLFLQAAREFREKEVFYRKRTDAIAMDILLASMRKALAQANAVHEKPKAGIADAITHYIHEHYDEPISNQSIAKALHYSVPHINRVIRQHTGKSLHQYLLHYRISCAVELLIESRTPISEIAQRTGFSSLSLFERTFKEKMGCSPCAIRHRQQR